MNIQSDALLNEVVGAGRGNWAGMAHTLNLDQVHS